MPAASVSTRDPAIAFAPLVRLDRRETAFPADATRLVAHAGLEWSSRRCGYDRDITPSGTLGPGAPSPLPPLVAGRLGRGQGYRARTLPDCETPRGPVFSTVQRTRPFDTEDRPVGLPVGEGFNLDIVSAILAGERRLDDGALVGVPAYYALDDAMVAGRPGIRLSYWMVFGLQLQPRGSELASREGDWERVDVLARAGRRPGRYVPLAVEYHRGGDRARRVAWGEAELAGPGRTHPVAYLERGMHTPRPDRTCRRCTDWRTWRNLRDVRREPWFGYGGGWGAMGDSDEGSGPSGPSPFVLGPSP